MGRITSYKIAWNTKTDEGVFIINRPNGVEQILVDSAQEASLLLNKLRNERYVHLDRALIFSSDDPSFKEEKSAAEKPVTVVKNIPFAKSKKVAASKKKEKEKERKATKKKSTSTKKAKDNLKLIEGIGPKIEGLLHAAGIKTFLELKASKVEFIKAILEDAGSRFKMHDPSTWGEQAGIADKGDFEALKQFQNELKGGRKV